MSLADRLAARTLELVDIPSESRDEAALAAHVLGVLREGGVEARDAGDTCVLAGATERGERPLVLLAGHFDTVPAQGNRPGRRDADAVHGLGAADMKGAVAVMVELALAGVEATIDLGYVFFGREELAVTESALGGLLEREAGLRSADLVVVMEPTANAVHAGCLGNVNATWTFHGRSGHSARPWLADNAIHRAAAGIHALAQVPPDAARVRRAALHRGGLGHPRGRRDRRQRRPGRGGRARQLPLRPRPQRRRGRGVAARRCASRTARWPSTATPPARPSRSPIPMAQRLIAAGDLAVEPKQAWTPVAEFAGAGVDAINFGPGDPAQAHAREEHVRVDALVRCYETIEAFACA